MVKEFELGTNLGIIKEDILDQIENIFRINGLPTQLPLGINVNKVIELMKQDKKGSLVFAFNKDNYKVNVKEEDIRKVLLK